MGKLSEQGIPTSSAGRVTMLDIVKAFNEIFKTHEADDQH